jgi:hypothetical protein
MSLKKDYRGKHIGPGGIDCPCCNPYNCHPRKSKPLSKRMKRRKDKEEVRKLKSEV